jgi:hypothetical protein
VEAEIQTEGTVRFSLMLKLADGRWVRRAAEAHIGSRHSWFRQRWDVPADAGWRLFDVATLATGDSISLTSADLTEIHGIGIRAQWPLNERWARVDQLHLYAKDLTWAEGHPAGRFAAWRVQHFGAQAANEALAGPAATPANDGVANLIKYAMGLSSPLLPSVHLVPQPVVEDGYLRLTYDEDVTVNDVSLVPEVSHDLVRWEHGDGTWQELQRSEADGIATIQLRSAQAVDSENGWFFRWRAEPLP